MTSAEARGMTMSEPSEPSPQLPMAAPLPAPVVHGYPSPNLPLRQAVPMMVAQAQSPVHYTPGGPAIVTDRRPVNAVVLIVAWVLAVLTAGYMLPWAIAATRGKSNHVAIGLVNFFLGWSVIGWIVALVMACQAHQVAGFTGQVAQTAPASISLQAVVPARSLLPSAGWYKAPDGGGQQYWDGATWTPHRAP
jgi:hypothetical protein